MALTDTAIRKIKPTEKSFKITDSAGLYLLIKPNGSKLWYMKYRVDGKEKKLAFGPYPDVSLFKARQLRDAARARVREGPILPLIRRLLSGKREKDRYRGGMMPRRIPALAGSPYPVLAETPYTSTSCHSGVKVSFWRSQKAYAGDRLCSQNHGRSVWAS